MRATRVDACGSPVTGTATDSVVSSGFVSIGLTANYEEGTDYTTKTAAGKLCISEIGARQLTRYTIEAQFCEVDPELFELIGGVRLVLDWEGTSVGYAIDRDPQGDNWALEVWTKVPTDPDAPCDPGGSGNYLYWLLPFIGDGSVGDFTIEDGAATFSINANTKYGNQWGRGPATGYNVVVVDGIGTAGRIAAPGVLASEHIFQRITSIAPPEGACGYSV